MTTLGIDAKGPPISIINNLDRAYLSATQRIYIDPDTGNMTVEELIDDIWQPASFETGANSLWTGKMVGIAGLGHHLATESRDGHLHFHVHSEYDGELTTEDAAVVYADFYAPYIPVQPDESEEWTGLSFDYLHHTTSHALLKYLYIKIGATVPTAPIRLQVWKGTDDTGTLAFDQKYPINNFSANTECGLYLIGKMEFEDDEDYLFRYSSDETFSLKTDTTGVQPTLAIAFSRVREDHLLQTAPYVDGETYEEDQYYINNRQIYICNTTGVQTGTFEDNSDLWDESSKRYIVGKFTERAVPFSNDVGKLTEDPSNLFYDALSYLHSPKLAIFDDDPILKRGHGLSLTSQDEITFDIVHVNTQTKSAYSRYNAVEDVFTFNKTLQYEGDYSFVDKDLINKEYSDFKSTLAQNVQATGLLEGGLISVASATTLNITPGSGYVAHFTDPVNPETVRVSWSAETGYTPANLATDGQYVVTYDDMGSIVEYSVNDVTGQVIRDHIIIGGYAAVSGSLVAIVTSPLNVGYNGIYTAKDFIRDVIGPANILGNIIVPNGTNLSLDNSGGYIFVTGSNFRSNVEIPDEKLIAAASPMTFMRLFRAASPSTDILLDGAGPVTVIDPTMWDDGSGTLQALSPSNYTVQVIYIDPDGNYFVAFGQETFTNFANAEQAVLNDTLNYEEYPTLKRFVRRAFIVVKSTATDLTASDVRFFEDAKFRNGGIAISAGVPGVTIPGGADTNIQFNDGGVFGGSDNLVWDHVNNRFGVGTSAPNSAQHIVKDEEVLLQLTRDNDTEDGTAAAGILFGVRIVPSGLTIQNKGAILFKRTAGYGRGNLVFAVNGGANNDNASLADAVIEMSDNTVWMPNVVASEYLDTPEISNTNGLLKIQPDVQGDVELFGDTDVGDAEVGKILYVYRKAAEGDDYIRLYVNHDRTGVISASSSLTAYGEESVTLHSGAENVIFRMGDDAGAKKTYFKNNSNAIVGSVDSLGNAQFNVSIDVPEISNTVGLLKIQPDVQGDVELFGDTDVANNENSKILKIWRRAPEGNDYIRFYISQTRNAFIHASANLTLQAQQPFTINSITDDIIFKVGDNAGAKKFYFKDSDGTVIANMDSLGNFALNGTVDDVDIAALDAEVDTKAPQIDPSLKGSVYIENSLRFHDNSTQYQSAERNSSLGHTHTAIPKGYYDSSAENIAERGMAFSQDGTKLYIIGLASGGTGDSTIWEYPLTTPWDLSTVGTPTTKSVETYSNNACGIYFSPDGRTMYIADATEDIISKWTSILPWNIATFNYVQELDVSDYETAPQGVELDPTGKRLYIIGTGSNEVQQYSLNTAWDISSVIHVASFGTSIDNPTCLRFNSDGRRMYVMDGSAEDDIHEYHLHTPWMISSAFLANLFDVSAENASPQGLFLKPDNSTIYMVGTSTPAGVYSYDLGLEVGGAIMSRNGPIQSGSMTTTERNALIAANGMMIYNTTTNQFEFYENGSWTTK